MCTSDACRYVCVYVRDGAFRGCRGGPNRGREKLALEYLKARRGGGGGGGRASRSGRENEMGANAAVEQREARRKRERKNESARKRVGAREKPREEKCSWDSGVDDQTPRQREKQQRRRRQKQRAALAVAEGGMPFIFSSLSSTSEALSHIFPAEARPRGGFLGPTPRDAHLTENPAAGALLALSFPRR